jgi:proline iminopeptidase
MTGFIPGYCCVEPIIYINLFMHKKRSFHCLLFLALLASTWACKSNFDSLKTINGAQLYCKTMGKGSPILFVHGGPGLNHAYFLPFVKPLAKQHKLIFYDQRSSGKSAIPADHTAVTFEKFVEDIEGVRAAFKAEKVNLLAHSFGAKLAVNYALKYPERLQSLIFVNPVALSHEFDSLMEIAQKTIMTPTFKTARMDIMKSDAYKRGDKSAYEALFKLSFQASFYDTSKTKLLNLAIQDSFLQAQKSLQYGLSIDINNYDRNYYPLLISLKAPVLIVHGEADLVPKEAAVRLKTSFENAELHFIVPAGHFPFVEQQAGFLKIVRIFLERNAKKSS